MIISFYSFLLFFNFWLRDNMLENLSVFNQYRRTNNNIESFHSNLKQTFQVNHPNLWVVLGKIIQKEEYVIYTQPINIQI